MSDYGAMDEIEEEIYDAIDTHHVQNVVAYLAELCEKVPPDAVSGNRLNDQVTPFREAAEHLRRAEQALRAAGFHSFPKLYGGQASPD